MSEFSNFNHDRRKALRITEALPFVIGHEGFEIEAVTINLSLSGAMCRIQREIPMMSQLGVALSLPGDHSARSRTVRMKGVVVRKEKDPITDTFFIAIYFSDMKSEDRAHLEAFIKRRGSSA